MESSLRNTPALLAHIDKLTGQLVSRYVSIVTLSQTVRSSSGDAAGDLAADGSGAGNGEENDLDGGDLSARAALAAASAASTVRGAKRRRDRNEAAVAALKMEVETAALIRAAEDILSLSRQMKELWLFGPLNTLAGLGSTFSSASATGSEDVTGADGGRDVQAVTAQYARDVAGMLEHIALLKGGAASES